MASLKKTAMLALVALALPAVPALSANPFLGRWSVETFGQTAELIFDFVDDSRMQVVSADQGAMPQPYTLDVQRQLLTLPIEDGQSVVLRYAWIGADTFELYMGEELLEQMTRAFTGSMPNGVNSLTDEIADKLRAAIRDVFTASPFMRARRIQ